MLIDTEGCEFEQRKLRMVCRCFSLPKAFIGILLLAGGLSLPSCIPFRVVSVQASWSSPEHDGWVPWTSVPRKREPNRSQYHPPLKVTQCLFLCILLLISHKGCSCPREGRQIQPLDNGVAKSTIGRTGNVAVTILGKCSLPH